MSRSSRARPLARNRLHPCRRAGCPARVGLHFVFCQRCWDELSRELQTALYAVYSPTGAGQTWRRLLRRACREHEAADQLEFFASNAPRRRRPAAARGSRRPGPQSRQDPAGGAIGLELPRPLARRFGARQGAARRRVAAP